ncbi:DUF1205 domain-containing protein [Amycolatopsis ultiminotia]|uniref:DUF1205 domain-containing protein n=1 Tax=Amycolatopsis ultiminotia TaxID=543629 RepID=A0ABP6YJ74_9PSEU
MRVLFVTWAWRSHLYAMVPLAWAMRAAGHDVLVASQPALLPEIERTGLPGVAVGTDVDAAGMVRGYLLPSGAAGPGAAKPAPRNGKGPRALQMVLANAESMTADLVELARGWGADLVVSEPTALAGPIAAAAAGVPAVRHLYGTDLMLRARPLLPDALAPLAAAHGVSDVDPFGVATIDPTPASLQVPVDYQRIPVRYLAYGGAQARPATARRTAGRVCLTWGHTISEVAPERFLLPRVLSALAGSGLSVVAAVSTRQRALLGDVDEGVEVVVDTAIDDVLPGCDLVVAHGGAGTVLTAVRNAVPMLLIPQLPDHTGHAGRVLATGAGEVLAADEASGERIREEALRLISGDGPRTAVAALAGEMRQAPAPAAVVARLEELAMSKVDDRQS